MTTSWCISINGGVWGNRHRSADETIAEVQQIVDRAKESVAYLAKHAPRHDGHNLWLNKWHRFTDDGRELWNLQPSVVEVGAGSTVHAKGPIIARWVGGERVL